MSNFQKFSLLLLRLSLGGLFLYAGLVKVFDSSWSAAGYLKGAKTFAPLYQFFLKPDILPVVNFMNEWGLTIVGLALIFGFWTRWASLFGALLMLLYYFPVLVFPYVPPNSFIVDEHIVYICAFLVLASSRAGEVFGIDGLRRV